MRTHESTQRRHTPGNGCVTVKTARRAVEISVSCLFSALLLAGCSRSYKDDQITGSWRLDNANIDARLTYYTNHTWALIVESPDGRVPSGSALGTWKLEGDRVSTITESALNNNPSRAAETARIIQLDASTLVIRNTDTNGAEKTSALKRADSPAAIASDDEYTRKLSGTWLYSYTNKTKAAGMRLYSIYEPGGTASWHGTIYKADTYTPAPNAFGLWRVEHGILITTITNTQANSLPSNQEARDQILQVTDSQFSFRDEKGALKKDLRVQ